MSEQKVLAVVVAGALSPGVNDLISSIIMTATHLNWKVYGFHDGFKQFATLSLEELQQSKIELTEQIAQSIVNTAGSYLRTSRFGRVFTEQEVESISSRITELGINYFCPISSLENLVICHKIAEKFKENHKVQVLYVAKTMNNYIPLPNSGASFGFNTAKTVGAQLVHNLTAETHSMPRYFLIETMGKKSGHLALAIAQGTNASICVIPEDFGMKKITLKQLCDYVQLAVIKRLCRGYEIGIIIISESLIYSLDDESLKVLYPEGLRRDEYGDLNLDQGDIGRKVSDTVRDRCAALKLPLRFCPKKFGYEMRGARPVASDSMIATQIGAGVVEGFAELNSDCLVFWNNGRFLYRPLSDCIDPATGAIAFRYVDVTSEEYRLTKKFQYQMTKKDFEDEALIAKMSEYLKITPQQFHSEYDALKDLSVI